MKTPLNASQITLGQLEVRLEYLIKKGEKLPFVLSEQGKDIYPRGISDLVFGDFFGLPVVGFSRKSIKDPEFQALKDVDIFYINPKKDLYPLYQDGKFVQEMNRAASLPEWVKPGENQDE